MAVCSGLLAAGAVIAATMLPSEPPRRSQLDPAGDDWAQWLRRLFKRAGRVSTAGEPAAHIAHNAGDVARIDAVAIGSATQATGSQPLNSKPAAQRSRCRPAPRAGG